ncbi:Uncharacterized protein FWK35_00002934, partial [Aphis craccivora]
FFFDEFLPNIWASASATLTRTTNACESFHSQLQSKFYIKINSINEPYKFQNTKSKKKMSTMKKIIQQ